MNSALQCLAHNEELTDYFLSASKMVYRARTLLIVLH